LLARIRPAVQDKAFHWFQRYRVTDGYSVYGGRAFLKFVNGQTNYEVLQRELEILDIMTHNRDKVIWEAAQGRTAQPDDSNLPPFVPVITNKPGPLPGGKHVFLSGEEAISKMTVGKGLKVQLFADEKMFPELVNPVQMAFDTQGRLWVAVWQDPRSTEVRRLSVCTVWKEVCFSGLPVVRGRIAVRVVFLLDLALCEVIPETLW
jgi:hypothetical protein